MLLYCAVFVLKLLVYISLVFLSFVVFLRVYVEPYNGVCKCKTKLHGKIALVTGGNSGIGLEAARDLARRGATVIIACRNEVKAKSAIEDIISTTGNPNVHYRYLDLFKPSCIRKFAEDFNKTYDRLDILLNNAGSAGTRPKLAENGVELVMQVNYFGPFLLTNLLMDKLKASKPSRIVIVSSKLYYFAKLNLDDLAGIVTKRHFFRYANSKLCNVLWARALAKRLPEGVTANSLHPGIVNTNIFERLGRFSRILRTSTRLFKTSHEGAQTIIHLCVAPELEGRSGGYYAECKLQEYYKLAKDEGLVENVWIKSLELSEAVK